MMQRRHVIRIAVSPEAKRIIEDVAQPHYMTEIGVASRIYKWFADQPDDLQRCILGLYGERAIMARRQILRRLLRQEYEQARKAGTDTGKHDETSK